MTNLAEGFMLISEQEKSGKVERRKDMQTMTSAYANKMLKSLEEDKAFWRTVFYCLQAQLRVHAVNI